ncbi:uncharacterized protein LOC143247191 isoform X5 [Tachypleus tridentatus]|uniref:uncharacterized protein LOC143247191 isoform X5 n=1 Tax=Tachypleus tridentatus TaxID=6853 RepID=UPI003FD0F703
MCHYICFALMKIACRTVLCTVTTQAFQNSLPNKTETIHVSTLSSNKSNVTAVKSSSWNPSVVGEDGYLHQAVKTIPVT